MDIHVIEDIDEARIAWNTLSPQQTIFHDWIFRFAFYRRSAFPLAFICAVEKEKLVGLLPLQRNTDKGYLEFFGGIDMEDNACFVSGDRETIQPHLLAALREPRCKVHSGASPSLRASRLASPSGRSGR